MEYQKAFLDSKNSGHNLQEKTEVFKNKIKKLVDLLKEK